MADPRLAQYENLIRQRARQYHRGWVAKAMSIEDLEQLGRMAVWEATRTWRADGGASFGTYVTHAVNHAMFSAHKHHGKEKRAAVTSSLDAIDFTPAELVCERPRPDSAVALLDAKAALRSAIDMLEPRLKEIIERVFWRDETLQSIGDSWGMTRERVRQLQEDAFAALRARCLSLREVGVIDETRRRREFLLRRSGWYRDRDALRRSRGRRPRMADRTDSELLDLDVALLIVGAPVYRRRRG